MGNAAGAGLVSKGEGAADLLPGQALGVAKDEQGALIERRLAGTVGESAFCIDAGQLVGNGCDLSLIHI